MFVHSDGWLLNFFHEMGHLHDDIIYYYDQNPSGFSFLVQITASVI